MPEAAVKNNQAREDGEGRSLCTTVMKERSFTSNCRISFLFDVLKTASQDAKAAPKNARGAPGAPSLLPSSFLKRWMFV